MVERAPDQGALRSRERDRLATELRYVTRHFDWDPSPDLLRTIVDWQIEAVAAARTEVWIPGMAGSRDPLVEEVLSRFYAHHVGSTVARLIEENAGLKRRLVDALGCIRSGALSRTEGSSPGRAAVEALLALDRDAEVAVIPSFLDAGARQAGQA
jgi:hypothetical protein